jgi:hypothetical protein
MFNDWIEKIDELPAGIVFIDESLRGTLDKVRKLSHDDLLELEAFLDYLLEESARQGRQQTSAKLCDFMAAGMHKAG